MKIKKTEKRSERVRTSFRMPRETKELLSKIAKRQKRSQTTVMILAIEAYSPADL